jgi:pyruvate,orthophosphate dikinase
MSDTTYRATPPQAVDETTMPKNEPQVTYRFGDGVAMPADISPLAVGNKAANLMRMAEAGLPVPPGFVITTRVCRDYFDRGGSLSEDLSAWLSRDIEYLERVTDQQFGGRRRPLLVSVRSGAPVSMPGMMDTILNVGLCDRTVSPLICLTGNPRFVWDSYRRLVQTYAEVVQALPPDPFDRLISERLQDSSTPTSDELDAFTLRDLTQEFLQLYAELAGEPFPQEPLAQLESAVEAVFRSWRSPRALEYRRLHSIPGESGTAVTVQAMVFGNMGNTSGSGVGFTRDPTTGENALYLDFLWNAQGEDVVSGRHAVQDGSAIKLRIPALDRQLRQVCEQLEHLFCDTQDFEFTIQEGRLYLLQSRAAKRTPWAALRVACDLVDEGVIDRWTALERLAEFDLDSLQVTRLASEHERPPLSVGVAACPGVAIGRIALDPQTAVAMAREGGRPILVRHDISTDDVAGLAASEGILTMLGGRTSHAAVVARQMNKVCIVGCRDLVIERNRRCRIGGQSLAEGDFLSLDGHSGAVYAGELVFVVERPLELLSRVKQWQ